MNQISKYQKESPPKLSKEYFEVKKIPKKSIFFLENLRKSKIKLFKWTSKKTTSEIIKKGVLRIDLKNFRSQKYIQNSFFRYPLFS